MNGAGCFIIGTGTEVGKTVVTAALLRALRRNGMKAVSMKPIQTGAIPAPTGLESQDLDLHRAAAGLPRATAEELQDLAPYRYPQACSPHLAGRLAGAYPDPARIRQSAERLRADYDILLVEGAGGVMAPVDESRTMLDLMLTLGYPVLLVAHAGLGTISETLLCLHALRSVELDILGVVVCEATPLPEDIVKADNPRAIGQFGKVPVLGVLRHRPELRAYGVGQSIPEAAWNAAVSDLFGLEKIMGALGHVAR